MPVGTTTHVSLNGREYIVKPYSYSKRQAPTFGARFSTGDPDFNNMSMWQHWAQKCFIGGVGQDQYADDAMFDEGIGVDTTNHDFVTLSKDLLRGAGAGWDLGGSTNVNGWKFVIYNDTLYALGMTALTVNSKLYKYDAATDAWVVQTAFADFTARSITVFDGKVFMGGVTLAGVPKVVYSSGAISSYTVLANPAGVTQGVYALRSFQQKLYVAFGIQIWRLKDTYTFETVNFYKANSASDANFIVAMEVHLGFLYMLSKNAHVHRTDGNATFDIWNWDGQTEGIALRSFDGRLFVLTFEYTNTADVGQGCLYQMTGSAVTQLKRWGSNASATRIGNMTVFDRKMFYGASNLLGFVSGNRFGFGVAAYDPIEDSHTIMASNSDTTTFSRGTTPFRNHIVDDQVFYHGKLFAAVRGHGAFFTTYGPRVAGGGQLGEKFDVTAAAASLASTNGGWFTTSTYDAGTPGVKKLWRKIVVDVSIPTTSQGVVVDYSTDNGTTWTTAITNSTAATRVRIEKHLNNVISTSLKLRFTLRSTVATASPKFYGFVVSYIPVPEPNWMWTMTLVLATSIEASDSTVTLTYDTELEMTLLSALHRAKTLTTFTDIDGTLWATGGQPGVLIHDIEFRVPMLGQPLEGEVVLTLLEAVETY